MRQIKNDFYRQFSGDKKGFFNRVQLLQLRRSKF
jgi:hypothetical protein